MTTDLYIYLKWNFYGFRENLLLNKAPLIAYTFPSFIGLRVKNSGISCLALIFNLIYARMTILLAKNCFRIFSPHTVFAQCSSSRSLFLKKWELEKQWELRTSNLGQSFEIFELLLVSSQHSRWFSSTVADGFKNLWIKTKASQFSSSQCSLILQNFT